MMRSMLLARLKRAYEANKIPVDNMTQKFHRSLTSECLLENAIYWEARAADESGLTAITNSEARKQIRAVCCTNGTVNGTPRGHLIMSAEKQYHGGFRE